MNNLGDQPGSLPAWTRPGVSTSVTPCGRALWPPTTPSAYPISACSCPGMGVAVTQAPGME